MNNLKVVVKQKPIFKHWWQYLWYLIERLLGDYTMPSSIAAGSTGKFQAQLTNNGVVIPLPSGSSWSWSTSDPSATIAPDSSVTDGSLEDVTIPATDASTQIEVSASVTVGGQPVNGQATSSITHNFAVTVTQTV